MKKSVTFFMPLTCIFTLVILLAATSSFRPDQTILTYQDNWEKLGERKVSHTVESDEITFPASGTILSAIKIRSKKGGINLQKCLIQFANGEKKSIELRNDIPPGGESRIIHLPGNLQPIVKFTFWYGVSQSGDQKAELEIWGKI